MVVFIFSDEKINRLLLLRETFSVGINPYTQSDSNLVDPASSHTLVSKIKPCMCKYK